MRTIRIVNVDLADEVITVGRIRHVRTVALMLAMVLAGLAGAGPAAAAELGVIRVQGYQQLFDAVAMLNAFPP